MGKTALLFAFAIFGGTLLCSRPEFAAAEPGFESKGSSEAEAGEVLDIKPHYSPIAVVELFVTEDCKSCVQSQRLINDLEIAAGNRRGRLIFLTYSLPEPGEEHKQILASGDSSSLPDEQTRRRWDQYGELFAFKKRTFPELVVNGAKYLSLTKPEILEKALDRSLAKPVKVAVSMELEDSGGDTVKIHYSVMGLPPTRPDDLYWLTIAAVVPHQPVPIYLVDGVDKESVWSNRVKYIEMFRLEKDESGTADMHVSEKERGRIKEFAAILQDARTGRPVSGETIRVKLTKK